jgi:hypothetical protein
LETGSVIRSIFLKARPSARAVTSIASVVALLACLLPAAATGKSLQPTAHVRSIPASAVNSGNTPWAEGIAPLGYPGGAGGTGAAPVSSTTSAPAATTSVGTTALLNRPGLTDSRWAPSDSTGAIGPNNYVEMVNAKIGAYDRNSLSLVAQAEGFVDPQIQWDQQAQRWLYLAIGPFTSDNNYSLAYGWSKTADPTDFANGYCRYVLPTSPTPNTLLLDDYPKLGHSDTQLVFGTNIYQGAFLGSRVWAVPKPQPGVTTCPPAPVASWFALRTPEGDCAATPVPANTSDSAGRAYVVAADVPSFVGKGGDCVAASRESDPGATASQIVAWHVSGPRGSPELVEDGNMNVPNYRVQQAAPQPGTTDTLDTLDTRLTQAVAHSDPDAGGGKAVWTQHTVNGPGGQSEVRWYELLPATGTVRQHGTIKSDAFTFNAAISPTQNGNAAAIFYNVSSTSQLPQIRAQSRQSSTPLGKMRGETILATSPVPYTCVKQAPDGACRWGDYSGASPDPINANAVWGSNMLGGPATRTDNWRTRNFAVSVGP